MLFFPLLDTFIRVSRRLLPHNFIPKAAQKIRTGLNNQFLSPSPNPYLKKLTIFLWNEYKISKINFLLSHHKLLLP